MQDDFPFDQESKQKQAEWLESLRKDAERYRYLRAQHWHDNTITAVRFPRDAMKLGYDAPSGDRLDDLIDAEMRAEQFPGVDIDAIHKDHE